MIFQQISQEGSEVRICACGGHGFPVYSLPGLEFSEKYRETMDFLEKNLVFKMVLNRSPKGNIWSAIPVALLCMIVNLSEGRQDSGPEGDEVL